jgi:general secretion pathway protein L
MSKALNKNSDHVERSKFSLRVGRDANQLLRWSVGTLGFDGLERQASKLARQFMADPRMAKSPQIMDALRRSLEAARRSLRWWRDELTRLIPARLRAAFGADPMALRIFLHENGSDVSAIQVRSLFGAEYFRSPQDRAAALSWAATQRRRWGALLRTEIALPASRCLIRQRELPAAAAERIEKILALELERTTPFGRDDVRQAWRVTRPPVPGEATFDVAHVIAKRALIDPLLVDARGLGLPIAAVDVADHDGRPISVNLLAPGEVPASLADRLNWAVGIALGLLLCVGFAVVFTALDRQQQALAALATETAAARTEAQAVRKRQGDFDRLRERISQLRQRRANTASLVTLWEVVSRLLPDSAWLTDMRLENDTLWIDGYARNAPELVGILAQSPLLSGVTLSSPVVREEARASERFQIRMKIEPAGAVGARNREGR